VSAVTVLREEKFKMGKKLNFVDRDHFNVSCEKSVTTKGTKEKPARATKEKQ
jgi:hypothetical protein